MLHITTGTCHFLPKMLTLVSISAVLYYDRCIRLCHPQSYQKAIFFNKQTCNLSQIANDAQVLEIRQSVD